MSGISYLSLGSDNAIRLDALQDSVTKAYVNSATVNATVKDANGVVIASGLSLSYINGSQGNYVGNLPKATVLVEGAQYIVEVLANDGAGRERTLSLRALAAYTN